jgi:hypothetical protein
MDMKKEDRTGSSLAETITDQPVIVKGAEKGAEAGAKAVGLSPGAYTEFYRWRANGVFHNVRFNDARITVDLAS